jgi:hypothetical protein
MFRLLKRRVAAERIRRQEQMVTAYFVRSKFTGVDFDVDMDIPPCTLEEARAKFLGVRHIAREERQDVVVTLWARHEDGRIEQILEPTM